MDFGHVARLSKDRRDLARKLAESDGRGDMELAESLRPTLKRALESLKALYEDEDVWHAAEKAVAAVQHVPTTRLIQSVGDYPESLPDLLNLFGYELPPPADQLVTAAVASLQPGSKDERPTVEVLAETRRALAQLLEKTLDLDEAQPWLLPDPASETIPALTMGITVATGALSSGVLAAIGTAVVPAAMAGGSFILAPMLILGGCHWWLRKRNKRTQDEKLLQLREQLSLDLVPAARAAVVLHLDAIVDAPQQTINANPQAFVELSDSFQVLIDITRRFGISDSHLRTAARREALHPGGNAFACDFLNKLPQLFAIVLAAKARLDAGEQIDSGSLSQLKETRQAIGNLGPRPNRRRRPQLRP